MKDCRSFGWTAAKKVYRAFELAHRAHSADVSVYGLLRSLGIRLELGEEKINLVVVPVVVVGDDCGAYEFGFCRKIKMIMMIIFR